MSFEHPASFGSHSSTFNASFEHPASFDRHLFTFDQPIDTGSFEGVRDIPSIGIKKERILKKINIRSVENLCLLTPEKCEKLCKRSNKCSPEYLQRISKRTKSWVCDRGQCTLRDTIGTALYDYFGSEYSCKSSMCDRIVRFMNEFTYSKILKKIGEGGFGKVVSIRMSGFENQQQDTPFNTVAVKIIKPAEGNSRKFLMAKGLCQIISETAGGRAVESSLCMQTLIKNYPILRRYFISFFGSRKQGETTQLFYEYFGQDLKSLMKQKNILLTDKVNILLDLVTGLTALHDIGIAHGDVKAANAVFIRDTQGEIRAKWADLDSLQPGSLPSFGTPEFENPFKQATAYENDWYGIGVIAYMFSTDKCDYPVKYRGNIYDRYNAFTDGTMARETTESIENMIGDSVFHTIARKILQLDSNWSHHQIIDALSEVTY
jgi:hypothetical protein